MSALGRLVVSLALETASYTQGLDKSSQGALKFAKSTQDAMDRAERATKNYLGGVVTGALGAIASYRAVESVINGVRDSINRLDQVGKAAQRFGINAEELQKLAYAGDLADVSLETLGTSAKKLSTFMVEAASGSKQQAAIFKTLGIESKNADGSLRSTSDVMADLADEFSKMEDGALKTALAVKIFGKAGSDMIPLLNGGKKAFQEAGDEAVRFGLVVSSVAKKDAEAFNDNMTRLGRITQGTFNQISASVLPVLVDFSNALVKAASEAGSLNSETQRLARDGSITEWARAGAVALTHLMDGAQGVGRMFSFVGKLIGGTLAVGFANPKVLLETLRNVGEDLRDTLGAPLLGKQMREQMAATDAARKSLAAYGNETAKFGRQSEDAAGKAAKAAALTKALADVTEKAAKKEKDGYAGLIAASKERVAVLLAQESGTEKLTAGEKALLDMQAKVESGTIEYAKASYAAAAAQFQLEAAEEKRIRTASELTKTMAEVSKQTTKLDAETAKQTDSLRAQLVALIEQGDKLALGDKAFEEREISQMRATAADLEWQAAMQGGNYQLEEQARLMRQFADQRGSNAAKKDSIDSYKREADEFKRINDEIGQGLTDALMRGGKSAWEYLKGLFRQLVLQPILRPLVAPISGLIAGLTSGGAAADGGGALNAVSAFSSIEKAYNFYTGTGPNTLGGNYSALYDKFAKSGFGQQAGLSAVTEDAAGNYIVSQSGAGSALGTAVGTAAAAAAGQVIGRAISGGYSALGGNSGSTAVNVGTVVGTVIGAYFGSPQAGAAIGGAIGGAVNRLFGRKAPEIESQYLEGRITGSNFSGDAVTNILEKGGTFRSDKRYSETEAITGDLDKALDEGAKSLTDLARKYGDALGLPVEKLADVSTAIKVKITGGIEDDTKAVTEALEQYADALFSSFGADLEPLRRSGETVAQTIERVGSSLLSVNETLNTLGLAALATSVEGGKAAIALADIFGGAGNLAQAASSYYSKFYNEAERASKATESITETLAKLGLELPATRDGYRDLVEQQDLTTEAGRSNFAVLLSLADAFDALQTSAEDAAKATRDKADADAKAAADAAAETAAKIAERGADLEIELLRAQGKETAAVALERQREIAALRELDPALASVKEAIYGAIDAANEAAKLESLMSGVDSVVGDFLSGNDLVKYKASRIQQTLAEGGIGSTTIEGIIGSTKDDILELWKAVGVDGRTAILAAYGAWQDLQEVIYGTTNAVKAYRTGALADSIEQARLAAMTPQGRIAAMKGTEAALFGQIATADDPVAVAQRLGQVIVARLGEEAQLNEKIRDANKDAKNEELEAAKRLKSLSQDIGQFTGALAFSDASPLSKQRQLGSAEALFNKTLASAQAGDARAQGNLLANARAYIDEANSAFASGPQAAAVYEKVTAALDQFAASAEATADPKIEALQAEIENLPEIAGNTGEMVALLESIDEALAEREISPADRELAVSDALLDGGGLAIGGAANVEAAAQTAQLTAVVGQLSTLVTTTRTEMQAVKEEIEVGVAVDRDAALQMLARLRSTEAILQQILTRLQVGAVPA